MPPTTGTPMSERPWAPGVVVEDGHRHEPGPGVRSISRTTSAPASRLPITATRSPTRRDPRCQANSLEWKRRAPMAMAQKTEPTRITARGRRTKWVARPMG